METIYTDITKDDYFIYSNKNKKDLLIQTANKQLAFNMIKLRKQSLVAVIPVFVYHKNKLIAID